MQEQVDKKAGVLLRCPSSIPGAPTAIPILKHDKTTSLTGVLSLP